MNKLKDCPFCGSSAQIGQFGTRESKGYFVICVNPYCLAETTPCDNKESAVDAWNRRVNDEVTIRVTDRMIGAIDINVINLSKDIWCANSSGIDYGGSRQGDLEMFMQMRGLLSQVKAQQEVGR